MAIKKQFSKTKPLCKVTFSVIAKGSKNAAVAGDFNNWNPIAGELTKLKNGTFKGIFDIPTNEIYEFRYLVDGIYLNEPEADSQKWSEFAGAENSVLTL